MMKVDEIIGNLLIRHNCVIIPGFGGFVAKQSSAQIDFKNGTIAPPKKSLLFNRQLINNDGLLISEFARTNALDYAQSNALVQTMIAEWTANLSAGNRISIDKIGFLFFDQERNICFEQDREFNLLLSSYGLGSVHFLTENDVAIIQHKTQSEGIEVPEEINSEKNTTISEFQTSIEPEIEVEKLEEVESHVTQNPFVSVAAKKSTTNFWKIAAAACLIPILFYSMWIPMKTGVLESKMIAFQDFNPFHKQEKSSYKAKSITQDIVRKDSEVKSLDAQLSEIESTESIYSYNLSEKTFVLVNLQEETSDEQQTSKSTPTLPETKKGSSSASKASYQFIIGCFSNDQNAQNLVNELKSKGFKASIVDKKNGLNRVSIGGANSEMEIMALSKKATELGFTGWILK